MNKVLVIGLDGATWNLIKPWVEEGKLPTFRKLMENGVFGELESTIPPLTLPAWDALTTGKGPGKLGSFSFLVRDGYNFRPCFMFSGKPEYIWNILSANGKRVCIANLPNIYSVYRINGCMVGGWLCLDETTLTYPKGLKRKLDEITNGYQVDLAVIKSIDRNRQLMEYSREIHETMEKHFQAFKYLLEVENWDLGFVVFTGPDRIQHICWGNKVVLNLYETLDTMLKRLLEKRIENTTVMLVSDHGFGPVKRSFNLNDWFIKEGYLRLKHKKGQKLARRVESFRNTELFSILKSALVLLPPRLFKALTKKAETSKFEDLEIDWKKTKAFSYGNFGLIYLNVKKRDPTGAIEPDDYEKVRNEIIQRLRTLKDPETGKRIPIRVFRKEEIYRGNYLDRAPDLIIQLDKNIQSIKSQVGSDMVFTNYRRVWGNHRINGIFLAHGPDIKKGERIENVRVFDIIPTILHVLKVPIPIDVDGRVLKEIFKE